MSQVFSRNVEDFECEVCGKLVTGNGYTNHCPHCLFSKHVDVYPGDRAAECSGLMKPIRVEINAKGYTIVHECMICGYSKPNRAAPEDEMETILEVMKDFARANARTRVGR